MAIQLPKISRSNLPPIVILILWLALTAAGCSSLPFVNAPTVQPTVTIAILDAPTTAAPIPSIPATTPTLEPGLPETEISFWADVPADTPVEEPVYLSVLDEVTGLALNAENYPMELVESTDGVPARYHLSLAVPVHSVVYYRYERQAGDTRVAEYTSAGQPVRYRLYAVNGQGSVEDFISRWADTEYQSPSGRIMGYTIDASTGLPIPNLLVTAGGQQTISASDGSFLLEGLPPGIHNLVALAMDGWYLTFQQGAQVAAESTTPADLQMAAAQPVETIFRVRLPADTPPLVPVRIAGNLAQLGNSYTYLAGGVNGLVSAMPVLHIAADGTYSTTVTLPAGAIIRYRYTLGDGFWNVESLQNDSFRVRQILLSEENSVVSDTVTRWGSGEQGAVIFDLLVPENTPREDQIRIQFQLASGWTEPIPMWQLGPYRWAYIHYGPFDQQAPLTYRYCRNRQCQVITIAGQIEADRDRTIEPKEEIQTVKDVVDAWPGLTAAGQVAFPATGITPRGPGFWAGAELQPAFHPTWRERLPQTMAALEKMGANTLILAPTWTFTRSTPPVLEIVPGQDMLVNDLEYAVAQGLEHNFGVAVFPTPHFAGSAAAFWQSATRDFSWWLVWFAHYKTFVLHHADIAAQTGAQMFILGGDWIEPALPGGTLLDGSPSGVPADAESRWRELIQEIRLRYPGTILWALSAGSMETLPRFLDAVDRVYILADIPPGSTELEIQAVQFLDHVARLQIATERPFVLGVNVPSGPQPQDQVNAYQVLLSAVNQRGWMAGFISRGFYPPMGVQDNSTSVHGKPSGELLGFWYQFWLQAAP